MEIENELNNNNKIENNNFLNNFIGDSINNAIDIGLKAILPDLIENQIIDVKNSLIKNGLKDGIKTAIDAAVNFGKSAVGIFTGNFENMTQVKIAISDGGIIDTISKVIDNTTQKSYEKGNINKSTSMIIKNGKNILMENISNNIKNKLDEQFGIAEKLQRYSENWKEYYNNRDFNGMEKEYNKIKIQLKNIIPLEEILKETRQIEAIHNLIKNNGKNFEISEDEKKLVLNLAQ